MAVLERLERCVIEPVLAGLDVVRSRSLKASAPITGRFVRDRDRRVVAAAVFACSTALLASVGATGWVLLLGPLVFGMPHLVAEARYLFFQPHRRNTALFADFAALPENEALVLELARSVGLPTVESRLWTKLPTPLLLVTRFDRLGREPIRRLHQEDFCQALGVDRRRKYEAEGGPSFARCVELVRETSVEPLPDSRSLMRWLAFCAVVGNRDNHGKNLSLLRDAAGRWRLAPFYGLICTTTYDRLARRLAMSVGGRTDAGNLPAAAWRDEASNLGVKATWLLQDCGGDGRRHRQRAPGCCRCDRRAAHAPSGLYQAQLRLFERLTRSLYAFITASGLPSTRCSLPWFR